MPVPALPDEPPLSPLPFCGEPLFSLSSVESTSGSVTTSPLVEGRSAHDVAIAVVAGNLDGGVLQFLHHALADSAAEGCLAYHLVLSQR